MHTQTHAHPPHTLQHSTLPKNDKDRRHPYAPAFTTFLPTPHPFLLEWGCICKEEQADEVPGVIKDGRVSGGGKQGCHTELQCQLMAQREACHLSDWWGLGVKVCVCG